MKETYPKNQSHSNINKSQNKSSYKQPSDKTHYKNDFSSSSLDSSFENWNW